MNFNYDVLLEYLSYKFKNYVINLLYDDKEEKDISDFISHVRRTLSALGHVEFLFDKNKKEYKIAPPVISILPNSTKGVLCGKRTRKLLESLKDKCQHLEFEYTEEDNYKAPKAIFIDFKTNDNIIVCQKDSSLLGDDIKIVTDFSKKLLYIHPNIEDMIKKVPRHESIGNVVEVYNTINHKFSNSTHKRDYCVCKKTYFGYSKYFIYRSDTEKPYFETDKYIAILNQYKEDKSFKKNIFELDIENNQLHINYINGLPELIDRALTLASGKNRHKGKIIDWNKSHIYSIAYDNINKELAVILERKAGLKIEVNND